MIWQPSNGVFSWVGLLDVSHMLTNRTGTRVMQMLLYSHTQLWASQASLHAVSQCDQLEDFLIALMASGRKIIKAEGVDPFKGRCLPDIASLLLNFRVKAIIGKSRVKGRGNRLERGVLTNLHSSLNVIYIKKASPFPII